jgi:hypothetical protein
MIIRIDISTDIPPTATEATTTNRPISMVSFVFIVIFHTFLLFIGTYNDNLTKMISQSKFSEKRHFLGLEQIGLFALLLAYDL